jgi:D-amino peptidase
MKIYISADIEGVTGVTHWDDTRLGHTEFAYAARQMTREVAAAARAAFEMGASDVLVKDAHGTGRNLLLEELPERLRVHRGWDNSPYSMMAEVDGGFDAVLFVGYHSAGGSDANPLAHSFNSSKLESIFINGERASEFVFNYYLAAKHGVPTLFLSGDEGLAVEARTFDKNIYSVGVKSSLGDSTLNVSAKKGAELIYDGVKQALTKKDVHPIYPEKFDVIFRFRHHQDARRASFYPGVEQVDEVSVRVMSEDFLDIARAKVFIV